MTALSRLARLAPRYDLIIIGGGITGAGLLREAVRTGVSVLLVDRHDFASGTSSWSSKLVHGGLRYLQSGQWRLTQESVRERGALMHEAPGLVDPQTFLMPVYRGRKPARGLIQAGLLVYDLMAHRRSSRWLDAAELMALEPQLADEGLLGAMRFEDAGTDDARLVQRLIEDSRAMGATALNYLSVEDLVRGDGRVSGVILEDALDGGRRRIDAGLVINATGVWAKQFASATVAAPVLRPLRGSHFIFPRTRLPVSHAISWLHPRDHRPVFVCPWQGAVVLGTTDLDHDARALDDVHMSETESAYLLDALHQRFPRLQLGVGDALCRYAGIRPVVAGGKQAPSAESRESAIWSSPGLVSVTGGKLTTFRLTARRVLAVAAQQVAALAPQREAALFDGVRGAAMHGQRLAGRFGLVAAQRLAIEFGEQAREHLGDTPYTLAELRWSARYEQVMHLDDLLLRRTRLGLICPSGGRDFLPRIRAAVQADLAWDNARWDAEEARYLDHWRQRHAPA